MRNQMFAVRLSEQERESLMEIAEKMERTPSDVVRRLIRQAAASLGVSQRPVSQVLPSNLRSALHK